MTQPSADPYALLALALGAARAAGDLLLERFGGPASGVVSKSTRTDLVSDADRDAEALILTAIRAARPDDAIVAEESGELGHSGDGVVWHIDPLDGTINYLWGLPQWCVSIHAADATGDLVGVVLDACRNETFTATPGDARCNDVPLVLDPATDLAAALVATGFAYDRDMRRTQAVELVELIADVRDVRRAGAAALDLAWVAAGRLDAYYERGLSIWDSAAGAMLVREAGGEVIDLPADHRPAGLVAARAGLAGPLAARVA